MSNTLLVSKIVQNRNRIDYQYTVTGEWKKYFKEEEAFFVEYNQNIEQVPASIAILPLIGNVILLASVLNGQIFCEEVDSDFFECIEEFLAGYQSLSPHIHFNKVNLVCPNRIVKNELSPQSRSLLFFSGGVDAWSSLISHIDEKPAMVSIWGADVACNNKHAWRKISEEHQEIASRYMLPYCEIHSNLHTFRYEYRLDEFAKEIVNDTWWSSFQHSVGMMSLAAPLAYGQYSRLYFGSTYCAKDKKEWGRYVIASDPQIDNFVRFAGCHVFHDGYELSRLEKSAKVCSYFADQEYRPFLRSCFVSTNGKNCGHCEKCANTIMGILLSGYRPEDYGFPYDHEKFPQYFASGLLEMAREEKYAFLSIYSYLQTAYRNKFTIEEVPDILKVFYTVDLEILADFLNVPCNKCKKAEKSINFLEDALVGKQWLENQYYALQKKISEQERVIIQLEQSGAEIMKGKDWLEEQYHMLLKRVAEQNTTIEHLQHVKKMPWWKRV